MKTLIIQGSARSDGHTFKICDLFKKHFEADIIHLAHLNIGQYDYEYENKTDDFRELLENMVNNYDCVIFASPVYWYSMSGHLKTFLDRITLVLTDKNPIREKLSSLKMAVIFCGSRFEENPELFSPFRKTASYLRMEYLDDCYTWMSSEDIIPEVEERVSRFAKKLNKA